MKESGNFKNNIYIILATVKMAHNIVPESIQMKQTTHLTETRQRQGSTLENLRLILIKFNFLSRGIQPTYEVC